MWNFNTTKKHPRIVKFDKPVRNQWIFNLPEVKLSGKGRNENNIIIIHEQICQYKYNVNT